MMILIIKTHPLGTPWDPILMHIATESLEAVHGPMGATSSVQQIDLRIILMRLIIPSVSDVRLVKFRKSLIS